MDVEDYILLFLSVWTLVAALFSGSVDVFLTLVLIGLLLAISVGGLFLGESQKEESRPLLEFMLVIFALIVLKKVYEVLAGG